MCLSEHLTKPRMVVHTSWGCQSPKDRLICTLSNSWLASSALAVVRAVNHTAQRRGRWIIVKSIPICCNFTFHDAQKNVWHDANWNGLKSAFTIHEGATGLVLALVYRLVFQTNSFVGTLKIQEKGTSRSARAQSTSWHDVLHQMLKSDQITSDKWLSNILSVQHSRSND